MVSTAVPCGDAGLGSTACRWSSFLRRQGGGILDRNVDMDRGVDMDVHRDIDG